MAISKINVNGVEHELQTTIDNVINLQDSLNKKLDKTGGEMTGDVVLFEGNSRGSSLTLSGSGLGGSEQGTLAADGLHLRDSDYSSHTTPYEITLKSADENEISISENYITFNNNKQPCGVVTGLAHTTDDTAAVPYGQMKEYIEELKTFNVTKTILSEELEINSNGTYSIPSVTLDATKYYYIYVIYDYSDGTTSGNNWMMGGVENNQVSWNNGEIILTNSQIKINAFANDIDVLHIQLIQEVELIESYKPFLNLEGSKNMASGGDSHAEGFDTKATNWNAHAEGRSTVASGVNSHAQGRMTTASGAGSHAEGQNTTASGDYGSHAEGYHTEASGKYGAHAEGQMTIAQIASSHAEGYMTRTKGFGSHAEGVGDEDGFYNTAYGRGSHVEGYMTTAEGDYSHAEGDNTITSGISSHAEGHTTIASGEYSHAEGDRTTASGNAGSHAEGFKTIASANAAHAEGQLSEAKATTSHAEGYASLASSGYQHVQGKYNVEDSSSKYAHIQGWGTASKRKNIHTVDVNGNAWFLGDVYVKSTSGVNKDSGSYRLVRLDEFNALVARVAALEAALTGVEAQADEILALQDELIEGGN